MRHSLGLIMRKEDKGEYDQLLTVYTKTYGKIDIIARGIRKTGAKLTGHVGLFYLSEIGFVSGTHMPVLTFAKEVVHFSKLTDEVIKIQTARRIAHLMHHYIPYKEKDEDMFHLIVGAFDYMQRKIMTPLELKFFTRYFEFQFLRILGYEPEDKTIINAFHSDTILLSEYELDRLAHVFEKHFVIINQ